MLPSALLLLLAAAGPASAHFELVYPPWRADSLAGGDRYSQYTYPCAGAAATPADANRTDWPVDGGALRLGLHHPWSYVFVNVGLGADASNFNYTLTLPTFWNETGRGTLCVPRLPLPAGLAPADGQPASLQVVTVGASGEALYNCADIVFRTGAVAPFGGANCTTTVGLAYEAVGEDGDSSSNTTATATATATAAATVTATASSSGARARTGAAPAWMAVAALAAAVACGLGV